MGSEWRKVKLEELVAIEKRNINPQDYKDEYFLHYSIPAYDEGKCPKLEKGMNIKSNKFLIDHNYILLSKLNPRIERVWLPKKLEKKYKQIASTEFIPLLPKANYDRVYCYYLLKFPQLRAFMVQNTKGTSNSHQRMDVHSVLNYEIEVPPLPEQQKIVSILSAFDDKIELNNEMNKTLEEIAQAIFKHWFIDFEFPNENGEPYKSNGGEFVDSELGPIPKGWKVIKISEICEIQIGGDWGKEDKFEGAVPVYCLRGVDLQKLKENGYSNELPLRWVKKSSLEKRMLSSKDILIAGSGIGPVGRTLYFHENITNLYEYPLIYSNFCKRIRAKSEQYAIYIEQILENMYTKGEMALYINGTSVPNLNINGLIEHKVVLPTDDILNKYADFKSKVLARKYSKENLTLSQLRDTLLPKLISGEIRVM